MSKDLRRIRGIRSVGSHVCFSISLMDGPPPDCAPVVFAKELLLYYDS